MRRIACKVKELVEYIGYRIGTSAPVRAWVRWRIA